MVRVALYFTHRPIAIIGEFKTNTSPASAFLWCSNHQSSAWYSITKCPTIKMDGTIQQANEPVDCLVASSDSLLLSLMSLVCLYFEAIFCMGDSFSAAKDGTVKWNSHLLPFRFRTLELQMSIASIIYIQSLINCQPIFQTSYCQWISNETGYTKGLSSYVRKCKNRSFGIDLLLHCSFRRNYSIWWRDQIEFLAVVKRPNPAVICTPCVFAAFLGYIPEEVTS